MSGKFIPEYRLSKAEWSFADEPLHEGGADLGPRLNKMLCRDCGEPVNGLECQREECRKKREGVA